MKVYHSEIGISMSLAFSYKSAIDEFFVILSAYLNLRDNPIERKYFLNSSSLFNSKISLTSYDR
jgi:hypothetical protein